MKEFLESYCDLVREIFVCPVPVVAALSGHAIAGGLIVAAAADERFAAEGAGRFGLSEVVARRAAAGLLPRALPLCARLANGGAAGGDRPRTCRRTARSRSACSTASCRPRPSSIPRCERARQLSRGSGSAYAEVKRGARAEAVARFDASRKNDPFLDFWFSEDARKRIAALVEKLTEKAKSPSLSS